MHAAGLVYRDFKMENIVHLQPGSYMVIDLEAVGKAGADLPAAFILRSWSDDTLTNERYTTSSDMHTISCYRFDAARRTEAAAQNGALC